MNALQRHFTSPVDVHGALGFHPDCPICVAERQGGTAPSAGHASGKGCRALAAVTAAGLIAGSGVGPSIAEATEMAEGDSVTQGTTDVQSGEEDDSVLSLQGPEAGEDAAPVDESADDSNTDVDPVDIGVDPTFGAEANPGAPATTPAPTASPPPAPPKPAAPATKAPSPPAAPAPPAVTQPEPRRDETAVAASKRKVDDQAKRMVASARASRASDARSAERTEEAKATKRATPATPDQDALGDAEPEIAGPGTAPASSTATASVSPTDTGSSTAIRGKRHQVMEGESLWSIAQDRLGDDASTDQIALYVDRLFKANAGRVSSPDQLSVGTVLVLP